MPAPTSSTPAAAATSVNVPFAVISIEILSPEIVHHVKIGPPVAVEIIPSTAKAVAGVVCAEPGFGRDVTKSAVTVVAHHEIRRPVSRVVIGRWILVLLRALVIDIETKINVEPSVAVIIRNGRASKRSLRWIRKPKCIGLLNKLAAALIQKQHRPGGADDNQILASVIIDIDKQRGTPCFQLPDARFFGDVFESSIARLR